MKHKQTVTGCKKLIWVELVCVTLIFIIDDPSTFYAAPFIALMVSLPLMINFVLLRNSSFSEAANADILFYGYFGAYICNVLLAFALILVFGSSAITQGAIGEAGGYWLLITMLGSISSVGGFILGSLSSSVKKYLAKDK